MYKNNLEFELRNLKMGDDNVFNSSSSSSSSPSSPQPPPPLPQPPPPPLPQPPSRTLTQPPPRTLPQPPPRTLPQPPPPKLNHKISKNSQHVKTNNTIKENLKLIKRSQSLPANMEIFDYNIIKHKLVNSLEISKTTNLEQTKLENILKNSCRLSRALTQYEENEIKTISRYNSNFSKIYYLGETFKTNYDLGIKDLGDWLILFS